jgi:UDP-3-O-[3-hydroxymyristoyl] glucosamine N-acyltransferase
MREADPPRGFTLADLAGRTDASLDGDGSCRIVRVGTLENGGEGAIAFLANPRYRSQLASTRASAVIVAPAHAGLTALPKLVSPNPYVTYARVASLLHPEDDPPAGIHASAIVHDSARVAGDATIGPYAVIGANAQIGARAVVGPGCVIGDEAVIGERVVLYPRAVVYARCVIGPRTVVHAGAVIGADGFGMAEDQGRWLRIPQVGRVVIGADCEIGANTTIDRGAIDDTIIEDDVKLDNQIQVAHNCTIGRHTAIAACVGIAGSVRIGRNVRIGGAAMISGHLTIPDGTVVSGATTVMSSPEGGMVTGVFPMLPHRDWMKAASGVRRLDALNHRLRALERALAARPSDGDAS